MSGEKLDMILENMSLRFEKPIISCPICGASIVDLVGLRHCPRHDLKKKKAE